MNAVSTVTGVQFAPAMPLWALGALALLGLLALIPAFRARTPGRWWRLLLLLLLAGWLSAPPPAKSRTKTSKTIKPPRTERLIPKNIATIGKFLAQRCVRYRLCAARLLSMTAVTGRRDGLGRGRREPCGGPDIPVQVPICVRSFD